VNGKHIVVIGGGTGSFTLLKTLKMYTEHITAIVNMADDGGSTGTLRDELGVLPPGDVRQCLVALSPDSSALRELFNYRFEEGSLKGHAFGNLFLTALEKLNDGNFAEAVDTASSVLGITGKVVPATLDNVRLKMSWPDKQVVLNGERVIDVEEFKYDARTASLSLVPAARANPEALAAIKNADIVIIAPGDLYTSLGPILVARGFKEALQETEAAVVYVCNLVTKHGQTDGFDVATHADEIERLTGAPVLDAVLYNDSKPPVDLLQRYAKEDEFWVEVNPAAWRSKHYRAIGGNFLDIGAEAPKVKSGDPLAAHRTFIRHDVVSVARTLNDLVEKRSLNKSTERKREYQKVDLLIAFDIDRTVFNEPYYTDVLAELGEQYGIGSETIHAARLATNEQGKSFDELGFIMGKLADRGSEFLEALLDQYKNNEFLYADTLTFLDEIDRLGLPAIALTHGSSWQSIKVAVSPRLQKYSYTLIDSPRKGFLLANSYKDGLYHIKPTEPGRITYAARRIFLFDDKQENFNGIPKDAPITAFYLENRSREKKRLALEVAPVVLDDLSGASKYLQEAAPA